VSPLGYKLKAVLMLMSPGPSFAVSTMAMEGWSDREIDDMERSIRRIQMEDIVAMLLKAPDDQLDHRMFPLIKKWDKTPSAIQILEVLDQCVHASLASGFTIRLLTLLYDNALTREKTTNEEVIKLATWRHV
jgi:hypothetical protein